MKQIKWLKVNYSIQMWWQRWQHSIADGQLPPPPLAVVVAVVLRLLLLLLLLLLVVVCNTYYIK